MSESAAPGKLQAAIEAYRAGDMRLAEARVRAVFDAAPATPGAATLLGGLLLRREAWDEADQVLASALANDPDSAELMVNRAIARRKLGDNEASAGLARQAAELAPQLPSAWNALAIALLELDRPAEAEKALRQGLVHHPDHPALTLHLGHAIQAQGQTEQARTAYGEFGRLGSGLVEAAEAALSRGHFADAEDGFRQVLAGRPDDDRALCGLGRLLLRRNRREEAVAVLERAVARNPRNATTQHFLAAATDQPPDHADADYVISLFDHYASDFDRSLVEDLGYAVPGELASLLAETAGGAFGEVLDLGCGTGLVGEAMARQARAIDGVDIAPKMLEAARAKGVYRDLSPGDMEVFLKRTSRVWDTLVAADVFIYFGRIDRLGSLLGQRLRPGGWFAFSVESAEGDVDSDRFGLDAASGRYRHGRAYLERVLAEAGFSRIEFRPTTIRTEYGRPIPGQLVVAKLDSPA